MEELAQIKTISELASVSYVRQKEPLGLGHAILCARPLVGDEPFGVFLGDDIIVSRVPCMRQLLDVFERHGGPVLAVDAHAAGGDRPLRRDRGPRPRRQRLRGAGSGREAGPRGRAVRPGHHRPLRAHARPLPDPRRDRARLARRDPAHQRAPHAARPPARSTPSSSRASATTPARSSASSRPPWSSPWPGRTWPTPSARTSRASTCSPAKVLVGRYLRAHDGLAGRLTSPGLSGTIRALEGRPGRRPAPAWRTSPSAPSTRPPSPRSRRARCRTSTSQRTVEILQRQGPHTSGSRPRSGSRASRRPTGTSASSPASRRRRRCSRACRSTCGPWTRARSSGPYEPVLVIEGTYVEWAEYETALLGFLCQASGIATKAARCKRAAGERAGDLVRGAAHAPGARADDRAQRLRRRLRRRGGDQGRRADRRRSHGHHPPRARAHVRRHGGGAPGLPRGDRSRRCGGWPSSTRSRTRSSRRSAWPRRSARTSTRCGSTRRRRGAATSSASSRRCAGSSTSAASSTSRSSPRAASTSTRSSSSTRSWTATASGTSIANAPVLSFALDIMEIEGQPMAKRGKRSGAKQVWRLPGTRAERRAARARSRRPWARTAGPRRRCSSRSSRGGRIVRDLPPPRTLRDYVLEQMARIDIAAGARARAARRLLGPAMGVLDEIVAHKREELGRLARRRPAGGR